METKTSRIWRIYDLLWWNRKFSEYSKSIIDMSFGALISPCDAQVKHMWTIDSDEYLITKYGRKVSIERFFWGNKTFSKDYSYMHLYLRPHDRHFFVAPCDGYIKDICCLHWDAYIPWIMALENIWIPVFKKFIQHNAAISFTIQCDGFVLWYVAVWSLNVNRIFSDVRKGDVVRKWQKIWHFLMWSGITLLHPSSMSSSVCINQHILIWEEILDTKKDTE